MSTEEKILKQVEFYFSDSNLPHDKFLRSLVANDPQGYVSIETIASFKKMKDLTTDIKEIVKAIHKSDFVEVDKEEKNVRRSTPLPENSKQDDRSIYAVSLFMKVTQNRKDLEKKQL
jgi:lupus La protein